MAGYSAWVPTGRITGRSAPKLSDTELRRVRLLVCDQAGDAPEARDLFEVLGIDQRSQAARQSLSKPKTKGRGAGCPE